jgi:hypothetical protein
MGRIMQCHRLLLQCPPQDIIYHMLIQHLPQVVIICPWDMKPLKDLLILIVMDLHLKPEIAI